MPVLDRPTNQWRIARPSPTALSTHRISLPSQSWSTALVPVPNTTDLLASFLRPTENLVYISSSEDESSLAITTKWTVDPVYSLACDAKVMATGGARCVRLYSPVSASTKSGILAPIATGNFKEKELAVNPPGLFPNSSWTRNVGINLDGESVLGTMGNYVAVWDVNDMRVGQEWSVGRDVVSSAKWVNAKTVVTGSADRSMALIDVRSSTSSIRAFKPSQQHQYGHIESLSVNPYNPHWILYALNDCTILYDLRHGEIASWKMDDYIHRVEWAADDATRFWAVGLRGMKCWSLGGQNLTPDSEEVPLRTIAECTMEMAGARCVSSPTLPLTSYTITPTSLRQHTLSSTAVIRAAPASYPSSSQAYQIERKMLIRDIESAAKLYVEWTKDVRKKGQVMDDNEQSVLRMILPGERIAFDVGSTPTGGGKPETVVKDNNESLRQRTTGELNSLKHILPPGFQETPFCALPSSLKRAFELAVLRTRVTAQLLASPPSTVLLLDNEKTIIKALENDLGYLNAETMLLVAKALSQTEKGRDARFLLRFLKAIHDLGGALGEYWESVVAVLGVNVFDGWSAFPAPNPSSSSDNDSEGINKENVLDEAKRKKMLRKRLTVSEEVIGMLKIEVRLNKLVARDPSVFPPPEDILRIFTEELSELPSTTTNPVDSPIRATVSVNAIQQYLSALLSTPPSTSLDTTTSTAPRPYEMFITYFSHLLSAAAHYSALEFSVWMLRHAQIGMRTFSGWVDEGYEDSTRVLAKAMERGIGPESAGEVRKAVDGLAGVVEGVVGVGACFTKFVVSSAGSTQPSGPSGGAARTPLPVLGISELERLRDRWLGLVGNVTKSLFRALDVLERVAGVGAVREVAQSVRGRLKDASGGVVGRGTGKYGPVVVDVVKELQLLVENVGKVGMGGVAEGATTSTAK
ncbi:hypothetical protein HDU85_001109 [Gaertneriomyces sp. JEL0708]|nr:hypothetical protein HDU85_001109 [Gaertneriomyces sp. JEL0708]